MEKTVKEIFGKFLPETVLSNLPSGKVIDINVNSDIRSVSVDILFLSEPDNSAVEEFKKAVCNGLKLNNAEINYKVEVPDETYSGIAKSIAEKMRSHYGSVSGFLIGADYEYNDGMVEINLKHGGKCAIENSTFLKEYTAELTRVFSKPVTVSFSGVTEFSEIERAEENEVPEISEASDDAPKTDKKEKITEKKPNGKPVGAYPVYLDTAKLFFGKKTDKHIKPLSEIDIPTDENTATFVAGAGEVFNVDVTQKTVKNDKYMVKVKFAVCDNTNTVFCTITKFFDPRFSNNPEADGNAFIQSLAPLKKGVAVIVNGDYSFDSWSKDFVLDVKSLATVEKYEETDNYEGKKRTELHCHTNMSAKDGVSHAGDIIATAYKWGHKAIAITDHGVVQSFPEAAKAVAKIKSSGGDFKVIYGVEGYFIDNTKINIEDYTPKQLSKMRNHQIILVKTQEGMKNLYKLISDASINHFYGRPVTLRTVLEQYREGLIIGSACEQGEVYKAIVDGKSDEEIMEIASFYDYLEIQPIANNQFMVRESRNPDKVDKQGNITPNRFRHVTSTEVIKNFNLKVVEIADKLNKPVVATGDVHFLKKEDGIIRQIIMAGQGYTDIELQAPLYLKTTEEMLDEFSYLGDRAKEIVIDNPAKIAESIGSDILPIPKGNFPPEIPGSDEELRKICMENAHNRYGENLPEIVEKRLKKELDAIINNGYSVMYISAQKLVAYSEENGYLVGSRGSVGSSFAATMAGISEVNPLPPHYVCPKCKFSEFFTDGSVGSGFDLPEKNCPVCGAPLDRDGHDIPFETFMGFKGDKVPDIDLNFSDEFQNSVQEYTKTLFGAENVFKAGTVSTVAEKTAYGFAKGYSEQTGKTLSYAELDRLASLVKDASVKTTSGQHPAGMIVVPRGMEIYDFCPIQHPADDVNSNILTTHFEFKYIHDTILKLDELGHVVPTTYKYLEEYSGIPVKDVSMSDKKIYSLFTSPEALGVSPDEIFSSTGTISLPEFGTKFTRDMLMECKPQNFADLLQISGLSHGTDVYNGNARDLIDKGICTISEVIGTRDNIMVYLTHKGMEEGTAFNITETVRKGKYPKGEISAEKWEELADEMRAVNVPEWYIESCKKIKYMFPKAHAAAYVIAALRLAWYKVYKPLAFYCAYFTARPDDVDVKTIMGGVSAVRAKIKEISAKGFELTDKEKASLDNLLIFNEMMTRGIEVLPIDINHSHSVKFVPEDGKMRLPFGSLKGVGVTAADAIYKTAQNKNFISKDDFRMQAGVSETLVNELAEIGALGDLPDSNQLSLF